MNQTTEAQVFPETAVGNEERSDARLLQEKEANIADLTADKEKLYRLLGEAQANLAREQALLASVMQASNTEAYARERAGVVRCGKASGLAKAQSNQTKQDAQTLDWWERLKVWFFNA